MPLSPANRTRLSFIFGAAAVAAAAAAWLAAASALYVLGAMLAAACVLLRTSASTPQAVENDRPKPLRQPQAATPAEAQQARLGPYRLESEMARGANSVVYRATDTRSGRTVAIKTLTLRPSADDDGDVAETRERFAREAETARRLHHPDIVAVFDAGETPELAWIAMEHLQGTELTKYATPAQLLPVATALHITVRVADALAHAHAQGIVHRDIKPANVMVDLERDMVKLADFGIARVADASRTRTGMVLGTPSFMAPEQLAGGHVDARSDVYALGVLLFQLLTGHLPFESDSMRELMQRIANDPPPDVRTWRPDVPAALADVVVLALQKRPEVRYASASQMADDLRTLQTMLAQAPADHDPSANNATGTVADPRHNSA